MRNLLITGCAGFIGYNLTKFLLEKKYRIVGIDNLDNYYSINLKKKRITELKKYKNFKFIKLDIKKRISIKKLNSNFFLVIHLAAQAGVKSSVNNPRKTISNNINGFLEILEFVKRKRIKNVIYASSSTVYGHNEFPFSENQKNNTPISIYGASKIANENMAYVYHNLYKINFFGLRFFTVYGSSLRPDMALYKFIKKIKLNKKIELFNYGKNMRDFTSVNDLNNKMIKIIDYMNKNTKRKIFEILNFGNGKKISTLSAVKTISKILKKKTKIKLSKKHKDDMYVTISDTKKQKKFFGKLHYINFKDGIKKYLSSL